MTAFLLLSLFLASSLAALSAWAGLSRAARAGAAVAEMLPRLYWVETAVPIAHQATSLATASPLPAPMQAPILLPTVTPSPIPAAIPAAAPTLKPAIQESVALSGLSHEWQSWNNCGPATLSMALSYHGVALGQSSVAAALRPNPEDKNVSPEELAAYARSQGLEAVARVSGDSAVLKRLLNIGLPVIVEVWLEPEPDDGFGHYRLLTGYDDEAQRWIAYDSYVGENLVKPEGPYSGIYVAYEEQERQWRVFNRAFMVLYPAAEQAQVDSALAGLADDSFMWRQALAQAQSELERNPDDVFSWFNQGSALTGLEEYAAAVAAYDRAAALGLPWRMLWYQFGPLQAYYETQRHQDLVAAVERTLATTTDVEELYYWYGAGLAALGDVEGGRAAWSKALSLRADYAEAEQALAALGF